MTDREARSIVRCVEVALVWIASAVVALTVAALLSGLGF